MKETSYHTSSGQSVQEEYASVPRIISEATQKCVAPENPILCGGLAPLDGITGSVSKGQHPGDCQKHQKNLALFGSGREME
jgi:hypothetical protein